MNRGRELRALRPGTILLYYHKRPPYLPCNLEYRGHRLTHPFHAIFGRKLTSPSPALFHRRPSRTLHMHASFLTSHRGCLRTTHPMLLQTYMRDLKAIQAIWHTRQVLDLFLATAIRRVVSTRPRSRLGTIRAAKVTKKTTVNPTTTMTRYTLSMWCDEKCQLVFRVGQLQPAESAREQFPHAVVVLEAYNIPPLSAPSFSFSFSCGDVFDGLCLSVSLCVSVGAAVCHLANKNVWSSELEG